MKLSLFLVVILGLMVVDQSEANSVNRYRQNSSPQNNLRYWSGLDKKDLKHMIARVMKREENLKREQNFSRMIARVMKRGDQGLDVHPMSEKFDMDDYISY